MKVRIRAKRRVAWRMRHLAWLSRWNARIQSIVDKLDRAPDMSPEAVAQREADFNIFWDDLVARQAKRSLVEGDPDEVVVIDNLSAVQEAAVEFVCARVKDGVVVDTFDTREAALALVKKHAKQKKAKLHVMDSSTGELILFSEEEMA